jgi:hypothetical protein
MGGLNMHDLTALLVGAINRTSLISALVGMKLFGWSKDYAWQDMLKHGFRWELPDLDAYWLEDVP